MGGDGDLVVGIVSMTPNNRPCPSALNSHVVGSPAFFAVLFGLRAA
jgi:hypothetical protein